MKLHLTQNKVEALNEPGEYRDDEVKGLLVRVSVNRQGKIERVYKLNARIKGGKVITTTLGPHGRLGHKGVHTLEQAKAWAQEKLRDMHGAGSAKIPVNPNTELRRLSAEQAAVKKQQEANAIVKEYTLAKALDDYLSFKSGTATSGKSKRKGELSPNTAALYRICITKHLSSWLGKPIVDITRPMVVEKYRKVCAGTEAGAGNTFRALRAICNWLIKKNDGQIISSNPVDVLSALSMWKEVAPRQDFISDLQLRGWWRAVTSIEPRDQADYFKMLLLTGLRKDELGGMLWKDVNFVDRFWTVRNTKNGRDHSLPFTDYVEQLLVKRYDQRLQDVFVFAGRSVDGNLKDVEHTQKMIQAASQVEFSPHTLRRTFATVASRQLSEYMVKRMVNHHDSQNVTQTHYVVLNDVDTLRPALQQIEDFILRHAEPSIRENKQPKKCVV